MKKRLLSLAMAVAMIFGSAAALPEGTFTHSTSIRVSAENAPTSGKCGENVYWSLDDKGVLTISGSGKMTDYDHEDDSPFYNRKDIKSVVIKSGVTSIGVNAFRYCENLTSVTIPSSVTSIGAFVFSGCLSLTSITIPKSVTSIGNWAFYNCTSLASVTIASSVTSIGNWAFYNCTSLASITIPSSVTSIGGDAFSGTKWLENQRKENPLVVVNGILIDGTKCSGNFTIPKSVTSIGSGAFSRCSSLTSITIPSSVTSIGDYAFSYCLSLASVIIQNGVTSIGDWAFSYCSSLASVTIPNSVTSIGDYAFLGCSSLTSITIPNSVTSIGGDAFCDCSSLASVTIQNGVTSIGYNAFSGTKWLENQQKKNPLVVVNGILIDGKKCSGKVTIPNSVTSISDSAFNGCEKLTSMTIPNSVKSIGNWAFYDCSSLTSVTILKSVTEIGEKAFGYYSSFNQQYNDFVIKGYNNTAAEKYAKDNEFKFEPLPDYSLDSTKNEVFVTKDNLKDLTLTYHRTEEDNNTFSLFRGVQVDGKPIDATNYTAESGSLKLTLKKDYLSKLSVGTHKLTVLFEDTYVETDLIVKKTSATTKLRLAGAGRYETAAKISQASFDQADTVVLAYGLNYADALAGVSLAKAMNAPILLTNLKTLPNETLVEIKRLGASNVIILGGTGAVGEEVEKILKENNLNIERIAGKTRFETATKIAGKMQALNDNKACEDIFFVYAFNSADALSVSAVAAVKGAPVIYLKTNGELDDATANYLKSVKGSVKNAYVIGGSGVISDDMMKKAGKALGVTPTRVFGKDRFATCVAVNEKFADVLDGDSICVATGMDFPDALAGGVYAAINKAPLFLVNGKLKTPKLTDEQKAYLKAKSAAKITAFGGVGVVPDNHIADIAKNSI